MWADTSYDPFTSIMDLPDAEARRVAALMGKRVDGDYLAMRRATESWLRPDTVAPDTVPLYFKLVDAPGTYRYPESFATLCIPADSIPAAHMTLTVDDSFFHYQMMIGAPADNTPAGLVPRVVNGTDAHDLIDFDGEHREHRGPLAGGAGRYIEVQVWDRNAPILEEARRRFEAGIPEDRLLILGPGPDGGAAGQDSALSQPVESDGDHGGNGERGD
ncbi:hypothetical protein [Nocardia sienata]|uniref:hypothetical protein n=1 Tax=Nocardia sienata TaxID=248552 RepID=UPI0012ED6A7A|nr:hypothetical protein [Nocardia sienata]